MSHSIREIVALQKWRNFIKDDETLTSLWNITEGLQRTTWMMLRGGMSIQGICAVYAKLYPEYEFSVSPHVDVDLILAASRNDPHRDFIWLHGKNL